MMDSPPTTGVPACAETASDDRWRRHAARLADQLVDAGRLTEPRWRAAFAGVPRHLLISPATGAPTDAQLAAIYADPTLDSDSELAPTAGVQVRLAAPRAVAPSILARVLGELRAPEHGDPLRVLQIGAGAGYVTALLCHGVGDRHVVATEPDPVRAAATARILGELGNHPTIVTAPRNSGAAEYGPYDRIVVLGEGLAVAPAWLPQLAANGRLVVLPVEEHRPPAVLERHRDGLLQARRLHGPVRGQAPTAVEFLVAHPGLLAELIAEHVPDDHGRCDACARLHGIARRAPCPVRLTSDLAVTSPAAR